ncbi:secondary thiamine-phosphate synthase enzyme YjbQ [Candidatus Lokiarchaeum ossiferum]|uniref:secondary thiamine-phosphate synthase enzyme YjbQ n=1 Tax=Candidatus Lokiarchaeum ossiferum TaxID=2951803 RepID=UPI00352F3644
MPFSNYNFSIITTKHEMMVDITNEIEKIIAKENEQISLNGICHISIPHTTAGVTINENADKDVKSDFMSILTDLIPQKQTFLHVEGNSDAHVKASLMGFHQQIIILNGKLQLGLWQGVMFCEFDGPRTRNIQVSIWTEA